jgi:hypothetical protein
MVLSKPKVSAAFLVLSTVLMLFSNLPREVGYISLVIFLLISFLFYFGYFSDVSLNLSVASILVLVFYVFLKDFFIFLGGSISLFSLAKDFFSFCFLLVFLLISCSRQCDKFLLYFFAGLFFFGLVLAPFYFFWDSFNLELIPNYPAAMLVPFVLMVHSNKGRPNFIVWLLYFLSFLIGWLLEARGAILALTMGMMANIFSVRYRKLFCYFLIFLFLFFVVFVFYVGLSKYDDLGWNYALTFRPVIWNYYLDHLEGFKFWFGAGPIEAHVSDGAAEAVKELIGRSGASYGSHSIFVSTLYHYGFLGFGFFLVLMIRAFFLYESRYWSFFVASVFFSMFSTVYIGAPLIYGVFLTYAITLLFIQYD